MSNYRSGDKIGLILLLVFAMMAYVLYYKYEVATPERRVVMKDEIGHMILLLSDKYADDPELFNTRVNNQVGRYEFGREWRN